MSSDLRIVPVAFTAAIALSACGYVAAPAFSAQAQEAGASYTLDTPIEQIAAAPQGAAILHKDIPGLLENSSYPMFKSMSLKLVASLSGGRLDAQTLAETQADLARLSPTAPPPLLQKTAQAEPDFN